MCLIARFVRHDLGHPPRPDAPSNFWQKQKSGNDPVSSLSPSSLQQGTAESLPTATRESFKKSLSASRRQKDDWLTFNWTTGPQCDRHGQQTNPDPNKTGTQLRQSQPGEGHTYSRPAQNIGLFARSVLGAASKFVRAFGRPADPFIRSGQFGQRKDCGAVAAAAARQVFPGTNQTRTLSEAPHVSTS